MDSSILVGVLQDLGVNISASAIYDFLKEKFGSQSSVEEAVLEKELSAFLKIHGVKAEAATVIKALADSGFLSIKGAELFAPDGILIGAGEGARFSFGENSASKTAKTAIHANGNARVEGSNAAVIQNADGSISFPIGLFPVQATNALLPIAGHCWKQPSNERSSSSDDLGGEQLKMLAQRVFVVKGLEPNRLYVIKPYFHSRAQSVQASCIL